MGYTTVNIYGSDASNARTRTAVVLAIQAAMRGKQVLLTEADSYQLRLLMPGKLVNEGPADLFTLSGVPDDRLVVALPTDGTVDEEALAPYLADRDLLVCTRAKANGEDSHNQVFVGGYDGMLFKDTEELAPKLPMATMVAVVPDPAPSSFERMRERALKKVPQFNREPVELPLLTYTTVAIPNANADRELWSGTERLLGKLDFSKKKEVTAKADPEAIKQALPSDGSHSGVSQVILDSPPVATTFATETVNLDQAKTEVDQVKTEADNNVAAVLDGFASADAATDAQDAQKAAALAAERAKVKEEHDHVSATRAANQAARAGAIQERKDALTQEQLAAREREDQRSSQIQAEAEQRKARQDEAAQARLHSKEERAEQKLAQQEQAQQAEQAKLAVAQEEQEKEAQTRAAELEATNKQFVAPEPAPVVAEEKPIPPETTTPVPTAPEAKAEEPEQPSTLKLDATITPEVAVAPAEEVADKADMEVTPAVPEQETKEAKVDVDKPLAEALPPEPVVAEQKEEKIEAEVAPAEQPDVAPTTVAAEPQEEKITLALDKPAVAEVKTDDKVETEVGKDQVEEVKVVAEPEQPVPEISEDTATTVDAVEAKQDVAKEPAIVEDTDKDLEAKVVAEKDTATDREQPADKTIEAQVKEAKVSDVERVVGDKPETTELPSKDVASIKEEPGDKEIETQVKEDKVSATEQEVVDKTDLTDSPSKDAASDKEKPVDKEVAAQTKETKPGDAKEKIEAKPDATKATDEQKDADAAKEDSTEKKDKVKPKEKKPPRKLISTASIQSATKEAVIEKYIDDDAIIGKAKYHGAAALVEQIRFVENFPNVEEPIVDAGGEPHKQYKQLTDWYRHLAANQKTQDLVRYAALRLFALAELNPTSVIANVSREFGVECLTSLKKIEPDFELLLAWYDHVCWLTHYHLKNNDYDNASKIIPPLIHMLYASKDLFFDPIHELESPEDVHNLMLAGLAILSAKAEEQNPGRFDDSDIESMLNIANSLKEGLSDEYKKALEPPKPEDDEDNEKVAKKAEEAAEAFGDM